MTHISVELCKIHPICLGRSEINSDLESPLCVYVIFLYVFFFAIRPYYLFCFFQSLALQDGCQKIGLEKIAPMLESTADSHVLAGSHLGLTLVEKTCSLAEPVTDEHDLLCDEEIHAIGNSALANRSASSLEKQCICCSFQTESGCSTTGSLNYIFLLHGRYSVG